MNPHKLITTHQLAQEIRQLRNPDSKTKKDRQAWLMLLGVLVTLFVGCVGYYVSQPPPLDKESLCRLDGQIPSHMIVLIDGTDQLPRQTVKQVKSKITALKNSIPEDAKLSLLLINGEDGLDSVTEIFSVCNPKTSGNPLFVNVAWAEELWEKKFGHPLQAQLDRLLDLPEANQTPLLHALQDISLRQDFGPTQLDRNLWIISDFLHHSEEFSQYSDRRSFEQIQNDTIIGSFIADLSGVSVTMTYVARNKTQYAQTRAHQKFWSSYFHDVSGQQALKFP